MLEKTSQLIQVGILNGINTGDYVMNNIESGREIDDKLLYEPSMIIIGLLPVAVVVWALALLYYFMLS